MLEVFNKLQDRESIEDIIDKNTINQLKAQLDSIVDTINGGFGSAPKFPHFPSLSFSVNNCSSDLDRKKIYTTYVVNFRPPKDRKPTVQEIKRYSFFLKEHISIVDPHLIVLFGSTAMESLTSSKEKISNERGKWNEIILKNKTYPLMITFNPSYLIRFPENKKFSWEDLKKIKQKILDLKIQV